MRKNMDTPSSTGHELTLAEQVEALQRERTNLIETKRQQLGKLHDYANMRDAQVVDLQTALEGVLNSMMVAHGTEMDPVLGPTYYCYGIHLNKANDLLRRLKAEGRTPPSGGVIHHE